MKGWGFAAGFAATVLLAVAGAPAGALPLEPNGCVVGNGAAASQSATCRFVGGNSLGVAGATDGGWAITHREIRPVFDARGCAATASGGGLQTEVVTIRDAWGGPGPVSPTSVTFPVGVVFTLTIFGNGTMIAGGAGMPDGRAITVPQDTPYDATGAWRAGECPGGRPARAAVRKSVTQLTASERAAYVAAVLKLKQVPSPYDPTHKLSYYDQFVAWHVSLSHCNQSDPLNFHQMWGHAGPMFLPWHREFVRLFERALNSVSATPIAVPYWDWTEHGSIASVFANDFMGGNGNSADSNAVDSGPFRKGAWKLNVINHGTQGVQGGQDYLTRSFGQPVGLPLRSDVINTLEAPLYDVAPYNEEANDRVSFRNALEGFGQDAGGSPSFNLCLPTDERFRAANLLRPDGPHNDVHGWVGGTMYFNQASPNDPVFFLHHANVDRIWDQWQQIHGVNTYLPSSGYPLNELHSHMEPFWSAGIHVTPADVLDSRTLGVTYAQTPDTALTAAQTAAIKAESARRLRDWNNSLGERAEALLLFTGRSLYCTVVGHIVHY